MKSYVAGFMFDRSRTRVALIRKNKPDWQRGKLNAIGGHIETSDASPVDAMVREFYEETGMDTIAEGWREFTVLYVDGAKVHFFMAVGDLKDIRTTTDEEVSIELVDRIPRLEVMQNLPWLVQMALDRSLVATVEINCTTTLRGDVRDVVTPSQPTAICRSQIIRDVASQNPSASVQQIKEIVNSQYGLNVSYALVYNTRKRKVAPPPTDGSRRSGRPAGSVCHAISKAQMVREARRACPNLYPRQLSDFIHQRHGVRITPKHISQVLCQDKQESQFALAAPAPVAPAPVAPAPVAPAPVAPAPVAPLLPQADALALLRVLVNQLTPAAG